MGHLWPLRGPPPPRVVLASLASRVFFETDDIAVIDKPPDVKMDGTALTMTTLARRWLGNDVRFVHRLDYGTSGVLVAALTKDAAARAGRAQCRNQV